MTSLWVGLGVAAVYALVALGFNIVFVASGTFNFAQAQFLMLGTMLAFVGTEHDWPMAVTITFCAAVGVAVGLTEYLLAIRPVEGKGVHGELVTTVGASVVIEGVALKIWGDQPRPVGDFVSGRTVTVLGGRVAVDDLVLMGVTVVLVVAVWIVSRRTLLGMASLAASEDREAAALRGVNVPLMTAGAVALSAMLATIVGPLVAQKTFAFTSLGDFIVLKAFLVLAIGGFGSYGGVLLGAAAVGLTEAYVARYWGSEYVNLSLFALLLTTLLAVPHGLFGERKVRAV